MGYYKAEEIAGIFCGEDLICFDCWPEINPEGEIEVLTFEEVRKDEEDGDIFICDHCGSQISSLSPGIEAAEKAQT